VKASAADLAVLPDLHLAREAEPVDLRIQGTESVREHLRQHRQHAACEVHRRAALARLAVDCAAGAHVVGDVGDRDDEPPAAAHALAVHGVVEVARVRAVDRDERELAQIEPVALVRGRDFVAEARGLIQHVLRPGVRQTEAADRHLRFDAGLIGLAEHFDDCSERLGEGGRRIGDGGDDELAVRRAGGLPGRDDDPVRDARVVGHDETEPALRPVASGDIVVVALEDLDEHAFRTPAPVLPAHANGGAVAVHQHTHLARRQIDVIATLVGHEEAVTVTMTEHTAGDHGDVRDQAVLLATVADELTVTLHRPQARRKRTARAIVADVECLPERLEGHGRAVLFERAQDVGATRHRLVVSCGLASVVRVALFPAFLFGHQPHRSCAHAI
jgi:hypothetical protein